MRKILFFILSLSVFLFSCKSKPAQKPEAEKPPVVQEEAVVETAPVVSEPEKTGEYVIVCPANMKKIDPLMATKLDAIAEEIKTAKPQSITVVGHSAKLNSEREEELAAKREIELIVNYLESVEALYGIDVKVENKGASEPLASHNDITARDKNRRVVITLH